MESKDWILLFTQVFLNGVIIALLQYWLSVKQKKNDEKNSLKLKALSEFLLDIESLKSSVIDTVLVIEKENILKEIADINSSRIKLDKCYYSKHYHLKCVSEQYNEFESNWDNISKCLKSYNKSMNENNTVSSRRWKFNIQAQFKPLVESLNKLDKAVNENY